MTPAERLIQRYHDGEIDRLDQAAVTRLVADDGDLAIYSRRLGRLDALLQAHSCAKAQGYGVEAADFAADIMIRVPTAVPTKPQKISIGHLVVGALAITLVAGVAILADLLRAWIDVEGIAAGCALAGLALVVAARPLVGAENGLLGRLLMKRVVVGDGEVLVCRLLGLALIIGGAHIAGIWS